jgi:hypothetical protein
MNLKMLTTDEIKTAYQHGELSVVALFNEVGLQLVVLAEALEKQTAAIKELQAMLAAIVENRLQAMVIIKRTSKNEPKVSVKKDKM